MYTRDVSKVNIITLPFIAFEFELNNSVSDKRNDTRNHDNQHNNFKLDNFDVVSIDMNHCGGWGT
jgi:hypothetical protein